VSRCFIREGGRLKLSEAVAWQFSYAEGEAAREGKREGRVDGRRERGRRGDGGKEKWEGRLERGGGRRGGKKYFAPGRGVVPPFRLESGQPCGEETLRVGAVATLFRETFRRVLAPLV